MAGKLVLVIPVVSSNTIDDVKTKIQDKTSIPLDQQRLIFAGAPMKERLTVGHYIADDCVIHVVVSHRGGGKRANVCETNRAEKLIIHRARFAEQLLDDTCRDLVKAEATAISEIADVATLMRPRGSVLL